jgi:multidrug efflux system outer membrane protein
LDVAQAQTTLFSAEASEAQYTRQIAQDMDEIVLLAGAPIPDAIAGADAKRSRA